MTSHDTPFNDSPAEVLAPVTRPAPLAPVSPGRGGSFMSDDSTGELVLIQETQPEPARAATDPQRSPAQE